MFNIEMFDVAIGLIFVYVLVSIICTAVREGIEVLLKQRAVYLERGIIELLHANDTSGESSTVKSFFTHPLISSLFSGKYTIPNTRAGVSKIFSNYFGGNRPSYIPSRNFALALMDIAARGLNSDATNCGPDSPQFSLESMRKTVSNIENVAVQRVLLLAIDSAQGDLNKAQASIEAWYNCSMDRVSGWYKRTTQYILFVIAIIITITLNVDTVAIVNYLSQSKEARETIVKKAETFASASASEKLQATGAAQSEPPTAKNVKAEYIAYQNAMKELDASGLPIGWTQGKWQDLNIWPALLGWLLTALAATLGAPFWFDVLNKVMVIRSTVKPHEKSPEESSEDRQITTKTESKKTNQATPASEQPAGSSAASGNAQPTTGGSG